MCICINVLSMCVCTCMFMFICKGIGICIRICIYALVYISLYVCVYIYAHGCMYVGACARGRALIDACVDTLKLETASNNLRNPRAESLTGSFALSQLNNLKAQTGRLKGQNQRRPTCLETLET